MLALRESWRVLRNDGILFWNICDSYYGSGRGSGSKFNPRCSTTPTRGLSRAKSLCLIPERIAISAQANGWIVRDIIIWNKPNCVPESVQDRCTRSYEVILMLTKRQEYFWNRAEAVEPSRTAPHPIGEGPKGDRLIAEGFHGKRGWETMRHGNKPGCSKTEKKSTPIGNLKHQALGKGTLVGHRILIKPTRTLRDVWNMPTYAHKDDHVAIFPEALAERLIKISTREGDTVLDPFAGSGSTGAAADRSGRNAILMDLSEQYCQSMMRRFAREHGISADDERWEG
jgi:DNA modification methylase